MAKRRLVVVGNGMAGARAVSDVLARGGGEAFDIVVFGAELHGNYNRIMLSGILDGTRTLDDIMINTPAWYADNGVVLHRGDPAVEIDRDARLVRSAAGVEAPYDVVLIATGSSAFIPPFDGAFGSEGALKSGIFGYRTLDDCRGIAAFAPGARTAATIGGGLLGLEVARALGGFGCESHVVHLADHLLDLQLDAVGGDLLRRSMEGFGVRVHTRRKTVGILGRHRVEGLAFDDGSTLACDMVVVAAGVRPNNGIALRAGLSVDRAIMVDDHMRSIDDPAIYAVGECAQHRGQVYGLVAPLWDQARVFADHVTDRDPRTIYRGSKLSTKLKVLGVELASMGITDPEDEHDEVIQFTEAKRGTYKKLIVRDGRLVGGILMGEVSKAADLIQAYDRGSPLPVDRTSLLFDLGSEPQARSPADMPTDAQVCTCNGVSKGEIGACVAAGHRDLGAVMAATRAGTGCGSCKPQVEALTAYFAERVPAGDAAARDGGVKGSALEDETFSFHLDAHDGHYTPDQLRRLAEVAVRYGAPGVRLGSGRRVEFVGLQSVEAARVWSEVYDGGRSTDPRPAADGLPDAC